MTLDFVCGIFSHFTEHTVLLSYSCVGPQPNRSSNPAGSTVFAVDTGRFLWAVFLSCLIIELTLVYLDLTVNWLRWTELGSIRRLFNTTREDALASWFAVTQTVFVALATWVVYAISRKQALALPRRIGWLIVALIFTYITVDDGAAVH